jgi:aspartyl-tRNA(Asn)/glutamyl-tRNA(Gln) amidotransferase subunit A
VTELADRTIASAGELLRSRSVSAVELHQAALERVAEYDHLNAFVTVADDVSRRQAALSDRELASGLDRGPLHGIPIGLKDCIATRGIPTSCGSPVLRNHLPTRDAHVVDVLRSAGAVILGKTAMYEFGYGLPHSSFGITPNPRDARVVSGGTSSGSACGVALGMCFAALGSDAGGSIRIPAAFCGVVGFKPSFGRVGRGGVFPGSYSLDVVGPLARTVADAATVFNVIADGVDQRDPYMSAQSDGRRRSPQEGAWHGIRVGVLAGVDDEPLAPGVRRSVLDVIAALAEAGAEVKELSFPEIETSRRVMFAIYAAEASAIHRRLFSSHRREYTQCMAGLVQAGASMHATELARAFQARQRISANLDSVFTDVDVVMTPASPITAYPVEDLRAAVNAGDWPEGSEVFLQRKTRYTVPFNLSGQPAIVVPVCAQLQHPVGIQLIGRRGEDAFVLTLGAAAETIIAQMVKPREGADRELN